MFEGLWRTDEWHPVVLAVYYLMAAWGFFLTARFIVRQCARSMRGIRAHRKRLKLHKG